MEAACSGRVAPAAPPAARQQGWRAHRAARRGWLRLQAAPNGGPSSNGATPSAPGGPGGLEQELGIPAYLQDGLDDPFCDAWEAVLSQAPSSGGGAPSGQASLIWKTIRREAQADAASEPLLSSFLYASILSHDSLERSMAFVLANRLSDATLLSTELFEVFYGVLRDNPACAEAVLADICAVRERDPACGSYSQALLYFKGFHAIQAHRIAHELWGRGRKVMACALQSRVSEVLAVDIHPAAKVGRGILLDHGTGVVIGETAEIGNNVSILQNVTLGGTGKEHGDRHPKISDNVLIGASATVLGNIRIGKGAQVAAGSLVLKPVPPRTMVAGSPAKEVGPVIGNPAQRMEAWGEACEHVLRTNLEADPFTTAASAPAAAAAAEAATAAGLAAAFKGEAGPAAAGAAPTASGSSSSDVSDDEAAKVPDLPAASSSSPAAPAPEAGAAGTQQQHQQQAAATADIQQERQRSAAAAAAGESFATGVQPKLAGKPRRPPAAEEPVEAVRSDKAAERRWPAKKTDPEYFI